MSRWREARSLECFFDLRKKFNLLLGYGAGETDDALTLFIVHWLWAETFETGDKRASEARQAVAVREDGFALDGVEGLANLSGGVFVVIEIADECSDSAFEIDVVFP